jgi:hypothetical protein
LPRAGNKAATSYKGQGKDTCKVIRIKEQYGRAALECIKGHNNLLSTMDNIEEKSKA